MLPISLATAWVPRHHGFAIRTESQAYTIDRSISTLHSLKAGKLLSDNPMTTACANVCTVLAV